MTSLTLTPVRTGSTYISLKSAILPSLSIARLDVILQEHFIFEHDIKQYNFYNQNQIKAKSSIENSVNTSMNNSNSTGNNNIENINKIENENHSETWDHHTITNLELVSDKDKEIMRGLYQVKSGQRPILNPAELADMEAFLGSKPG